MPSNETGAPGSYTADVAVVGGGLAGLQCAVRLTESHPKPSVLLLDPDPLGGCSKWAVGSFTAGGTRWQSQIGIDDSPAAHFEDLLTLCRFEGSAEDQFRYRDLLMAMCEAGPDLLDELSRRGIEFSGPYPEDPHRYPRMHNAVPSARRVASVLATAFEQSPKAQLAVGAMTGLAASGQGFSLQTTCGNVTAQAVVIASGDQSGSCHSIPAVNSRANGLPLKVVSSVLGARLHAPQCTPGLRTFAPGKPLVAPVNQIVRSGHLISGKHRFPGDEFLADPAGFVGEDLYLETDPADELVDGYVCTFPGVGYARLTDLGRVGLASRLGETAGWRVGPMRVVITLADGGLDVNHEMQVLQAGGTPIEGLYACGTSALGGITLGGHGHHLLWAVATGSAGARSIANRF